ncbi:MAG TPA: YihY/virulence factor BrkB family protein [Candidatus Angelobacter sp.]|nr:YihY/virulence factor BrkB family protein [Candidatus Angelobacter sp.]
MEIRQIREALWRTGEDINRKHTLQMAAALSYYFVMSMFPALILFSAILAYLPVHDLLNQTFSLIGGFMPKDTMNLVEKVLSSVVSPYRSALLSFGILGTLWAASGGFSAMIEALNIAYEVEETRPFWRTRPLSVGLTVIVGLLLLIALGVMIAGPNFGGWLAGRLHLSWLFAMLWPYIHWGVAVGFAVLSVEWLYFLAPNVKQRFLSTLPGAVLSVGCWIGLSYGLGVYFRSFANFDKTYGTLGAAVALMVWLYWTGFAVLLGAEMNCQFAKETKKGKIPEKEDPQNLTKLNLAA